MFTTAFRGRRDAKYDLLRARREQLEANQNMLLGRLAYYLSKFIRDPLISAELILIGVGYEKFCDRAKTLERGTEEGASIESDSEDDGFHVWRM